MAEKIWFPILLASCLLLPGRLINGFQHGLHHFPPFISVLSIASFPLVAGVFPRKNLLNVSLYSLPSLVLFLS
jgi:hypothetical protein